MTPPLLLSLTQGTTSAAFHVSATSDTGCTKTIINKCLAVQHNLELFKGERTLLVAANGNRMTVSGTTTLTVKANGITRTINAVVLPARHHGGHVCQLQ